MVNASLSLVGFLGILILIYTMILATFDRYKIFPPLLIDKNIPSSPISFVKITIRNIHLIGRRIGLPLSGMILFWQGWRLDPPFAVSLFFLLLCIFSESLPSVASDIYYKRTLKIKGSLGKPILIFYNILILLYSFILYLFLLFFFDFFVL